MLDGELQNPVSSSFADLYLLRLVAASKEKVHLNEHGTIVLPRWQTTEENYYYFSLSYGYYPAEVAFALALLNDMLAKVSHKPQANKLTLSKEMLLGFSGVLGYYNFFRYLLQLPHYEEVKTQDVGKDVLWFDRLCDLSQSFAELESVSSQKEASSWLSRGEMPLGCLNTNIQILSPDLPCWITFKDASSFRSESAAVGIVAAEKRRLLAFIKSLRMLIAVLEPFALLGNSADADQQRSKAVIRVKEVAHQRGSHTYHLELADPIYLTKSYPFLVTIPPDDDVHIEEEA